MPRVAGFLDEAVRGFWSPCAGGVVREVARVQGLPDIQDGIHDAPGGVHAVVAVEECHVADHAIVEKRLVACGGGGFAEFLVAEIEWHIGDRDAGARALGVDIHRDAFIGLHMDDEAVWHDVFLDAFSKEEERGALEADHDLRRAGGEALAAADEEWHIGPAPVVHLEFHGNEGLGVRLGIHIRFGAVGGDIFSADDSGAVLASDRVGEDFLRLHRADGLEHFHLFVAHAVAGDRGGRLHGHERKHGEDVVLHHVARYTGVVVVAAAQFHAELLGDGDLHIVDVAAVPDRLEDAVAKTEDHDVLHGLFAEVVVDAVNLRLGDMLGEVCIQLAGALQVVAEGLFNNDAAPGVGLFLGEAAVSKLLDDFAEEGRSNREVEKNIAGQVPGFLDFLYLRAEMLEGFWIVEVSGEVIAPLGKVVPLGGIDRTGRKLLDVRGDLRAEKLVIAVAHRHADHGEILRQKLEGFEIVERRQELAFRQVARGAEDDNGAGVAGTFMAGQRFGGHTQSPVSEEPPVDKTSVQLCCSGSLRPPIGTHRDAATN